MGESKHVKTYREKYLTAGDSVVSTAEGYIGRMGGDGKDTQHWGALIVTRKIVVFYRKGFFGEVNKSIPLDKVTSIEQGSAFAFKMLRIHTSHDDIEFKMAPSEPYREIAAAVESGRVSGKIAVESPLDALKKLGELRQAGVISESEFEEKKRNLMALV